MKFERLSRARADVAIEIIYCVVFTPTTPGSNEWGIAVYPLKPVHEIVGQVTARYECHQT